MATEQLAALVARLEVVTKKLERSAGGGGGDSAESGVSSKVSEYDDFIKTSFGAMEAVTNEVDLGNVKEGLGKLKEIANEQRKLILFSTKHFQPASEEMAEILSPMMKLVGDLEKLRDNVLNPKNKCSRYEGFFLEAIHEAVTAFSWIQIPLPVPYIQAMIEAVSFHTNKILKEKKDSGKKWVATFKQLLEDLKAYVKNNYTTGFSWADNKNPRGTAAAYKSSAGAAVSGGAPPPPPLAGPPPPPPAGPPPPQAVSSAPKEDTRGALMASLNRGSDVTTGLKKVTDDMKTHKNPNLRLGSAVPYKKPTVSSVKPATAAKKPVTKPPKLALEGKRWNVEHQEGQKSLVIEDPLMKHTVYIYKCNNSTVTIKKKVNSITMDTCKKVAVVFESCVSGIEFINSQSVQAQVMDKLDTALIEKTDGCILYLSKNSLNCQIITAKSSEMNVSIPNDSGQFDEYPIVEQFKTVWDAANKKLVTECHDQVA